MFGLEKIFKKKDPFSDLQLPSDSLDSPMSTNPSPGFQDSNGFPSNNSSSNDFSLPSEDNLGLPRGDSNLGMDNMDLGLPQNNSTPQQNFSQNSDFNLNSNPQNNFGQNLAHDFNQVAPNPASSLPPGLQDATPLSNNSPVSSAESSADNRDLELISSKLDVIKGMIENLSHRTTILEQKIDMQRKRSW